MGEKTVKINTETKLCAVIGNPVKHSLSPAMHNAAFQAADLNYVYLAFNVTDVQACVAGMRALPSFRGMSVTIPHKVAVMPYLDEVDALARHVGCVNTITNENGRLVGTSTDGLGTLRVFERAGVSLRGKRVLFIGSGGAVRSVAFAFAERGAPAGVTILGRTPAHVDTLVADLEASSPVPIHAGYLPGHLHNALGDHDIIIHGTPTGMHGHDEGRSCVPRGWLSSRHVVFDMVYRPQKTQFLEDAEAVGCRTVPGLEMLLEQAMLQFEIWTGAPAPGEVMRAALLAELAQGHEDQTGSRAET